jgi:hypothetical protein
MFEILIVTNYLIFNCLNFRNYPSKQYNHFKNIKHRFLYANLSTQNNMNYVLL